LSSKKSKAKEGEGLTVACVGPQGSGKTHFYTLLAYHLLNKRANQDIQDFEATGYCMDNTGARLSFNELLARLSYGQKLPPTSISREVAYKFLIRVKLPRLIGSKEIRMPLLDLSGEVIAKMMDVVSGIRGGLIPPDRFGDEMSKLGVGVATMEDLYNFIINADVFIHIFNLEDLHRMRRETAPDIVKKLAGKIAGYANFINALRFLRELRGIKKPMRHVFVFTFYDKIRGELPVETECGYGNYECIANWLFNHYAITIMSTGISGENKFVSYTEEDPSDPNKFKLTLGNDGRMKLSYPEEEYDRILAFLKSCA